MDFERVRPYAPLVVRIGVALVFLWFGINQLLFPSDFLGYLPSWVVMDEAGFGHVLFTLVHLAVGEHVGLLLAFNGVFEMVFGLLLLVGLFTRVSALLLSLHLFGIMVSLGYNDIAVRDFGLVAATFSVFLYGKDTWCWDDKRKKTE